MESLKKFSRHPIDSDGGDAIIRLPGAERHGKNSCGDESIRFGGVTSKRRKSRAEKLLFDK